jgi:serine protease AprX
MNFKGNLYKIMRLSTLSILSVFISATLAFAAHPKISHDMDNLDPGSTAEVIVQFTQSPAAAQHKKVTDRGGAYRATLAVARAGFYTIPVSALNDLANDPEVVYISPNRKLHGTLDNTTAAVNAAAAWSSGLTGAGVGVAVIDSGLTTTADLTASSIVYNGTYVNNDVHDYYGHGTHVAGIIAGSGARSHCTQCFRNLQGVAPGVNIINIRVLDQNGAGTDSTVIQAINQAISLKSTYNIRVINLSLGRPVFESYTQDPLCQAVEAAWKAGIVVVVAAGNDGRDNSVGNQGYGTITAPGNDPYVITVGAANTEGTYTRTDDKMTSYSSKGPTGVDHIVKPDLVAPGNRVVSLYSSSGSLYTTYPANGVPMSYFMNNAGSYFSYLYYQLSGTSMATPVVSGAVALLLQSNPSLTPDQVKAKLMLTAWKGFPKTMSATDPVTGTVYSMQSDAFTVGAGYLDIQAALADTNTFSGPANSPVATFNSSTGVTGIVCGSNSICASAPVVGNKGVWGVNSVWGSSSVWGTNSVWGSNSVWGTKGVWGVTSIYGASSITTDSTESTSTAINGEN